MSSEVCVLSNKADFLCLVVLCLVNNVSNNCSQAKLPLCSSYLCPPLSSCFPFVTFSYFSAQKEGVNLKSNLMCYVSELPEADG